MPSDAGLRLSLVFVANVFCSACSDEVEVLVDELDELDGVGCECGHGYVLESVAEADLVAVRPAVVVRLRGDDELRLAA